MSTVGDDGWCRGLSRSQVVVAREGTRKSVRFFARRRGVGAKIFCRPNISRPVA